MSTPEQIGTEVAKGIGEAAKEIIVNLLGPSTSEAGLFAGDLVANWRMKNLIKVYEKASESFEGKKLPKEAIERLPFGFRALFIEEASKEDEDSVQYLWAALLKQALEQKLGDQPKLYLQVLQNFSPLMVLCLKAISEQQSQAFAGQIRFVFGTDQPDRAKSLAEFSDADIRVAIERLVQLGVLEKIKKRLELDMGMSRLGYFGRRSEPASQEGLYQLAQATETFANEPEIGIESAVIRRKIPEFGEVVILALGVTHFGSKIVTLAETAAPS